MTTTVCRPTIDANLFGPQGYATRVIGHQARWLVRQHVYGEAELEDARQDLCLRILRRLQQFDPQRSRLKTFIARAVQYEALELYRQRCQPNSRRERRMQSLASANGDGASPTSETITRQDQVRGRGRRVQDEQEQWELTEDVQKVLESLPEDLRTTCQQLLLERHPARAWKRLPMVERAALRNAFAAAGLGDRS